MPHSETPTRELDCKSSEVEDGTVDLITHSRGQYYRFIPLTTWEKAQYPHLRNYPTKEQMEEIARETRKNLT